MEELVTIQNNQAVTTSLMVAKTYNKENKSVNRAIKNLMAQDCTVKKMFEETTYVSPRGREERMYYMNRDGYTLLVMGFEGKDALQFKLKYMEAFNKMEAYIKEQQNQVQHKPASSLEVLKGVIDSLIEQNAMLSKHDGQINNLNERLDDLETRRVEAKVQLSISPYLSKEFAPDPTTRECVHQLVNNYSEATGMAFNEIWNHIYSVLDTQYSIRVGAYKRLPGEKSKLDVVERIGAMPKAHAIITRMVNDLNNK